MGDWLRTEGKAGFPAAFIADISVTVIDEGQSAQGLGDEDGAVFHRSSCRGLAVRRSPLRERGWLIEGPGTADDVFGTIVTGSVVGTPSTNFDWVHVHTIRTERTASTPRALREWQTLSLC